MNINQQKSVAGIEETSARSGGPSAVQRAWRTARRLWWDQHGASLIEYGVLVALVALAGTTFLPTFSGKVKTAFTNLGGHVEKIGKEIK